MRVGFDEHLQIRDASRSSLSDQFQYFLKTRMAAK